MNLLGNLCRELYKDMNQSQRTLALKLGISLGQCSVLMRRAEEEGLIANLPGAWGITVQGKEYLEQFRVKNAVILAAGMDTRFVPFTHEKPKCLMRVEGQRIIDRMIRQMREAGIEDITVVVGYLAEKLEYLKDRFGVKLLVNPEHASKSNIASIHTAAPILGRSYLVSGDLWMWDNMFQQYEPNPWCACHWQEGPTDRWWAETDGHRRIIAMQQGGRDRLAMLGPLYLDDVAAKSLLAHIEKDYNAPAVDEELPWQTAVQNHLDEIKLFANILPPQQVQDFATLEELREFDTSYMEVSGNKNLQTISTVFGAPESRISGLSWQDIGMNNQSFIFSLDGAQYICRIPGEGTENYITRRHEAEAYKAIEPLHISDEVVYFNPESGFKIAKYYANSHNVEEEDMRALQTCMEILRRLHLAAIEVEGQFDILQKASEYEAMCREVDCIHYSDFEETKKQMQPVFDIIRDTGEPNVLCHCDAAHVNFLMLESGDIKLLDWEYAGMCHGVADVAMYGVFSDYSVERIDQMLAWYYGRTPTLDERTLCFAYYAASGFLWSMWALFREYYGEDFGDYTPNQYRIAKRGTALVHQLLAQQEER